MIPNNAHRRSVISGATGRRNVVRGTAFTRDQANFGNHLSTGPYGGVALVDNRTIIHQNNSDEGTLQPNPFAGNFTKGLDHEQTSGFVANTADYQALVDALKTVRANEAFPDPQALGEIDAVPRAISVPANEARPFVNPLGGLTAGVTGVDPYDVKVPPAPKLASRQAAIEMVELYWMAALRDKIIDDWAHEQLAHDAARELNALNQMPVPPGEEQFARHYDENNVLSDEITFQRLFRGSAPGNDVGPYISQFLIRDVAYGTLDFEQQQKRLRSDRDYLTTWPSWLEVQNGANTAARRADLEDRRRARHIVTLRDLAHYVHFDALHEAYFNAALILDGLRVPLSPVNPYAASPQQEGFGTLGGPHLLVAVSEVATRALRAVWHQKWLVHRRLRPEAMGARIEYRRQHPSAPPDLVDDLVLQSDAVGRTLSCYGTALLPQAFPEGSPMHPSYGAGHATVAGACTTVLKAFFKTDEPLPEPKKVAVRHDGATELVDLGTSLTVVGELNKLAANIAIGRNGAGVHYRSDYTKSLTLGEAVAVALLQEEAMGLKEGNLDDVAFQFDNFSGKRVEILYSGAICSLSSAKYFQGNSNN